MKYETPELTALTLAMKAIQSFDGTLPKYDRGPADSISPFESVFGAYTDWE
jgi:hypothetical protein